MRSLLINKEEVTCRAVSSFLLGSSQATPLLLPQHGLPAPEGSPEVWAQLKVEVQNFKRSGGELQNKWEEQSWDLTSHCWKLSSSLFMVKACFPGGCVGDIHDLCGEVRIIMNRSSVENHTIWIWTESFETIQLVWMLFKLTRQNSANLMIILSYVQKLSRLAKTFQVAMQPRYRGFCASGQCLLAGHGDDDEDDFKNYFQGLFACCWH